MNDINCAIFVALMTVTVKIIIEKCYVCGERSNHLKNRLLILS